MRLALARLYIGVTCYTLHAGTCVGMPILLGTCIGASCRHHSTVTVPLSPTTCVACSGHCSAINHAFESESRIGTGNCDTTMTENVVSFLGIQVQ